jgi:hypothetical protein
MPTVPLGIWSFASFVTVVTVLLVPIDAFVANACFTHFVAPMCLMPMERSTRDLGHLETVVVESQLCMRVI